MFKQKNRIPKIALNELLAQKKYISSGFFVLKAQENDQEHPRFAVVVSKKVSRLSVKRHLVKRIFVEMIKKHINEFKNADFLFILSPEILKTDRKSLEKTTTDFFESNKLMFFKNL